MLSREDVLVAILATEEIVDIENVVIIFVIVTIIMCRLAGLRKNSSRVCGRLVGELGIAPVESSGDVGGERLECL